MSVLALNPNLAKVFFFRGGFELMYVKDFRESFVGIPVFTLEGLEDSGVIWGGVYILGKSVSHFQRSTLLPV